RALELRVGTIRAAEPHPNADRLLVLRVDLGSEERQIVAGIRSHYDAAALVGRQVVVVANLEPARLRGGESQGMGLAATDSGRVRALRDRPGGPAAAPAAAPGTPRPRELLLPESPRRRESRLPRPPLERPGGARASRCMARVGGPRGGRAAPGTLLLAWYEPAVGTRPRAPPRARSPPAGRAVQRARSSGGRGTSGAA